MQSRIFRRWNAVSLRTKVTGVSVLLLTFGLLVSGLGSMYVLKSYLTDEVVDARISNIMRQLTNKVVRISDTSAGVSCTIAEGVPDYYIAVLDVSGAVICSNRDGNVSHPDEAELKETFLRTESLTFTVGADPAPGQSAAAGGALEGAGVPVELGHLEEQVAAGDALAPAYAVGGQADVVDGVEPAGEHQPLRDRPRHPGTLPTASAPRG